MKSRTTGFSPTSPWIKLYFASGFKPALWTKGPSIPPRPKPRRVALIHFQQSCEKPVRVFDEYSTYPITSELWRGLSRCPDSDRHAPASAHATSARRRSWLVEIVNTLKPGRCTSRLNPVDSVHPGSRRRMNRSSRLCGAPPLGRQALVVSALSPAKPARRAGPLPLGSKSKYSS